MALGFDFAKLFGAIVFYAITVAAFILVGMLGSGLLLADESLGGTVPFVIGLALATVGLLVMRLTRKRWVPPLREATRGLRNKLGIVYAGEELEHLEHKTGVDAKGRHLAKLAEALDRRYKDDPQVRTAYESAIEALAVEDPAHAARLYHTYFGRFQGLFEAPVQLVLLRALRTAGEHDLATRSGERWLQKHPDAKGADVAEILSITATLLERSLHLHEAAAPYYQRLLRDYPGTPFAEAALRHLKPK